MIAVVLTIVVVTVTVTVAYRWNEGRQKADRYPAAWDVDVAPLAAFVENERGLKFEHPVYVDFLPEDEFVALFETGEADLALESAADDAVAADARALSEIIDAAGLSASYDPVADQETLSQVSTLGFYDPSIDRIAVRGDDLTPAVRTVLVHELTHALQDQWYELETGGPDDLQLRAVIEADAMRIEDKYLETLPEADRDEAVTDNSADETTDAALASVPWPLVDQSQAPYVLGPNFIQRILDDGGEDALAAVFENPPTSEELLDPWKYGDGPSSSPGATPPATTPIALPPNTTVFEEQREWSMYDALLMLDAWLPWRESRSALDGWAGGSYVSYLTDGGNGPACFSASTQFDAPEQATTYGSALSSWASFAGSTTEPTVQGSIVTFEACPRPEGAADPPVPILMTSESLFVESLIVDEFDVDGSDEWATCVARTLVDDQAFAALAIKDVFTAEEDVAIEQSGAAAALACDAALAPL
jgi:hypothetical protein